MVRYSFLVRLFHPLLHAGLSRRILDHLIRPHQHIRWYRDADLLGGYQVNHELKLRGLLDWQIGGLSAFENFVYVGGRAPEQVRKTHSVKHQTTRVDNLAVWIDSWQPILRREGHDPLLINADDGTGRCSESLGAFL